MKTELNPHAKSGGLLTAALLLVIGVPSHPHLAQSGAPRRSSFSEILLDCDPDALPAPQSEQCRLRRRLEGQRLFEQETFGGNGRTCVTCHSRETGTISPEEAQARLANDPSDPLFVHDGLDDGFAGTSRILKHATVRITLPLPSHLTLQHDPGATEVTFNRGTPTTKNTPALDPALMLDLRAADLKVQALGAIHAHAQNTIEPTDLELELIAEFQRTSARFFSDGRLKKFAQTGVPPKLPEGTTESEKRGRLFFIDAPFEPPSPVGVCALCHSGPMLNQANVFSTAVFANPPGARAFSVGVSEANFIGNPTTTFMVHDGLGPAVPVTTPDIGVLMTDPATSPVAAETIPPPFVLQQFGLRLAFFANIFKTPTLWDVNDTAPYFHDNSAKDLDGMLKQYDWFFLNVMGGRITLTVQDKEDIKTFLRLL
jgi:cytochrome c peroxidase